MRKLYRLGMLLGTTAVLVVGIFAFVQARSAALESAGGQTLFLPAILTPPCDVFFDDFSDSDSGWPRGLAPGEAQVDYIDDEYLISSKGSGIKRVVSPAQPLENYLVQAEMYLDGPPTNALIGLVFGLKFDVISTVTDYYVFVVLPDTQEFALFRLELTDPGGSNPFTIHTIQGLTESLAIHTGSTTNHLTAVRNGDQIELAVNGTDLGAWTDANITGLTYTGLALNPNPNNIDANGRYDNFNVQTCVGNSGVSRTVDETQTERPTTISDPVNLIGE